MNQVIFKDLPLFGRQQRAAIDDLLRQQRAEVVHLAALALKKHGNHQHVVIRGVLGTVVVAFESAGQLLYVLMNQFLILVPDLIAVFDSA